MLVVIPVPVRGTINIVEAVHQCGEACARPVLFFRNQELESLCYSDGRDMVGIQYGLHNSK